MPEGSTAMLFCGVVSCVAGGVLYVWSVFEKDRGDRLNSIKQLKSIADIRNLPANAMPLLVAVRGQVWANAPLVPKMDGSMPAVISRLEEGQVMDKPGWLRSYETIHTRRMEREVPWCLQDASESKLPIIDGRFARPLELDKVGETWSPARLPFVRRFIEEQLGIQTVGMRQTEDILPVGTELTAVGELAPRVIGSAVPHGAIQWGNSVLVLQRPRDKGPFILVRQTVEEMVAYSYGNSRRLMSGAGALVTLGVVILAAQGVKALFRMHRRWLTKRHIEEARRRRDRHLASIGRSQGDAGAAELLGPDGADTTASASISTADADDSHVEQHVCVVCYTNRCDTVFPACGHVCTCRACSQRLNSCPVCRTRCTAIRIYHI